MGRAVDWRLARIECTRSGGRIFGGCQVRPRSSGLLSRHCIHGESPRGGGGWNIPLPCLLCQPLNVFRWNTPTARRVPRLLPPPGRGRAVDWRLAWWPCQGTETGFRQGVHIKPWRCSSPAVHRWDITPWGRGWNIPLPCLLCQPKNLSRWMDPHLWNVLSR